MAKATTLAVLSALLAPAVAETVHGVVVYTRHGDRTTKHYGAQALTSLGAEQNFQVGSAYRERYLTTGSSHRILNISEFQYVSSQVWASAPDQGILLNTATAFLQGLYPPLSSVRPELSTTTLNNGSGSTSPLGGYQYVVLHGEDAKSPDAIWIKGDDGCPTITAASNSFEDSVAFKATEASTKPFYEKFLDMLKPGVYDMTSPSNLSYADAFDIFDLVNVAHIHNATSLARNVSTEDLFQLRTLADSSEWGYNYNASQPERNIHGRTLANGLFTQLNQTVTTKGKLKFSLMAGSYDTFMSFFGLTNLPSVNTDFYGLPDYASTMAFELFTTQDMTAFPSDTSSLRVRFLFRNGTAGTLTPFPLFGLGQESLPWSDFVTQMSTIVIPSVKDWCSMCKSTLTFCAVYNTTTAVSSSAAPNSGLSNAVAGVIGAMVTLGVVAIIGALAFVLLRKKRAASATTAPAGAPVTSDKTRSSGSQDGSSV